MSSSLKTPPSVDATKDKQPKVPLSLAPPPWHTLVVWTSLLCLFLYLMPSLATLDQVATVETFTNRLFPDHISLLQLGYIRLAFATVIWMTSLEFFFSPGSSVKSTYLPGTRLIQTDLQLFRFRTFWPFTCVAWNILGASFTIAGFVALQQAHVVANGGDDANMISNITSKQETWLLRAGIVTWTMTAPMAALVSIVVRYALWPTVLKQGNPTDTFKTTRALLMHNFNIFASVVELALLGGLPVRWCDISMGPMLGLFYVLASWILANSWGIRHDQYGPQYLYFFLDTTQPGMFPTAALLALLAVLLVFFALFASMESVLPLLPWGIVGHVLFVVFICSISMKFRD